ncbi:MAG TPA: Gfo/Idh/MocA family oxidoreductase [Thermoanaerobaculia bacterium]|nr:Gfo/Idh/MocA family oxidoreductase [Thermoanaerobaculia bacterium]
MRTIRVAVVGTGYMGARHVVKYASLDRVEVVAVVDQRAARAQEVAEELKCQWFARVEDLLTSDIGIDAASIATPTATHFDVTKALLDAGVHCLVEKPLALTSEEASRLVSLAHARKRTLLPGHIERFNPAVRAVRARRPSIQYITAYRVGPMSFRSVDTDVVLDVMTHDIDIALFLTGCAGADVTVVRAFASPENINDIAKAELRIGSCVADLVASRLAIARRRKMRIFAADGYYSIDCSKRTAVQMERARYLEGLKELRMYQEMRREVSADEIFTAVGAKHIVDSERDGNDALTEELQHFLSHVRGEATESVVTGEDGVAVVRIAEAILRSCAAENVVRPIESFRATEPNRNEQ